MTTKHDELMLDPEYKKLYAVEGLIADTAQLIWDLMERKNLKQADLARLLNKTPAFVSQLLNGKANMTIRTLAEVVYALDATIKIQSREASSSICEATDEPQMQTFSIHMSARNSGPRFQWEGPEILQPNFNGSDSRPGLAA